MKSKEVATRKVLNYILMATAIIFDILMAMLSFAIMSYSGLSKGLFIGIYVGVIVLMLIVNGLAIISVSKKVTAVKLVSLILSLLITLVTCFGYSTISKINVSVGNIVENAEVVQESLSVAFVTYDNNIILKESDIKGRKFGIINNEKFQEGNVLAKEELEAKDINVDFVEYENYNDLLLGLFSGECEVAALPANYYDMFKDNDGFEDYLKLTDVIYKFDKVVEVENVGGNQIDVTTTPFTVLVIGIDEGRSDSMILMSVNPITMTLTMTSIARDSYVPIAYYKNGQRDKINHARAISRQCTIDTVEDWLDVDIDFYVETNFKGVVEIVDAIGGLKITSPIAFVGQNSSDERGHYTVYVPDGTNYLNGEQVLCFARERHQMPNGDYDRQMNQQQVIKSLIESVFSIRDINKLLGVLEAAGSNISTNMSINQMTSLANYIFKIVDYVHVDPSSLIKIKNSRITGYSSYYYNYSASLPLWIMIPYKGAVKDAQNLIRDNLTLPENKVIPKLEELYATATWYELPTYYQESYNEVLEHIDMPDFMPNMKSKYMIDEARAWCNARGISLNIIPVNEGDPLYSAGLANGLVVDQSVKYATLTENFSSLTLWVIGGVHIPDFVGTRYSEAISWCNANGFNYSISWIKEGETGYVAGNAGLVESQTNSVESELVSVRVFDYPTVTEDFPGNGASKASVTEWANRNGVSVEFIGDGDKVVTYSVTNYTGDTSSRTIKKNSVITVNTTVAEYTVTFKDMYGNVIATQTVQAGGSATAPAAPAVEGKTFVGWSGAFSNITANTEVTAQYKDNEVTPPVEPEPEQPDPSPITEEDENS